MDCCVPTAAYLPVTCTRKGTNREMLKTFRHICFAKNRGFGTDPTKRRKEGAKTPKENVSTSSNPSKLASGVSRTRIKEAQELAGTSGKSNDPIFDRQFLEKIESVRRSAYEQKKAEGERNFQPIDYDAPIESEQSKIGLATKIGVGVAVAVFGVVFAFGDSFPSGSNMPSDDNSVIEKKLSEKERSTLEETVRQFQETLSKSPKDSAALEIHQLVGFWLLQNFYSYFLGSGYYRKRIRALASLLPQETLVLISRGAGYLFASHLKRLLLQVLEVQSNWSLEGAE